MKKYLPLLPLFTAFVVPGALGLEIAGIALPASFSLGAAFSASVAALLGALVYADYRRGDRVRASSAVRVLGTRAVYPLAA